MFSPIAGRTTHWDESICHMFIVFFFVQGRSAQHLGQMHHLIVKIKLLNFGFDPIGIIFLSLAGGIC